MSTVLILVGRIYFDEALPVAVVGVVVCTAMVAIVVRGGVNEGAARWTLLGTLVLFVALSPEIPVDIPVSVSRAFTLRLEDLLLLVVLLGWTVTLHRSDHVYLPPFAVPFAGYLAVALVVTVVGIGVYALPAARAALYLLKEVQFLLFALLVANLVKSRADVSVVVTAFIFGGVLNATWMAVQLATGDLGPLFHTVDIAKWRYGPSLLGQPSVLASAGFYLPPVFLTFGMLLYRTGHRVRIICCALLVAFLGSMMVTVSRATIGATLFVLSVFTFGYAVRATDRNVVAYFVAALLAVIPFTVLNPLIVRRFLPQSVFSSIVSRLEIWNEFLAPPVPAMLVGFGKGSPGAVIGPAEAHNFYLRLLVETGIIGLVTFLLSIAVILQTGVKLVVHSDDPLFRTVGTGTVGVTAALLIVAIFQDVFINVKVAETFWLLIGMAGAVWRLYLDRQTDGTEPENV
ncbi:hypothetical protein BV210_11730 [Halorientalis sp. IM1011]|nr:hypothetical protein BV210_11730 [Halorientalis sp. IM1011]